MSDREVVATNRKAHHEYTLEDSLEAGLVLTGSEIKSIREHRVNLKDGYVTEQNGELWLMNVHVSGYDQAGAFDHDPLRPRKLLLRRKEITRLEMRVSAKGLTLVPLKLYFKGNRAKVELGLCRGKKLYDKRETIKEREVQRELARVHKQRVRG